MTKMMKSTKLWGGNKMIISKPQDLLTKKTRNRTKIFRGVDRDRFAWVKYLHLTHLTPTNLVTMNLNLSIKMREKFYRPKTAKMAQIQPNFKRRTSPKM